MTTNPEVFIIVPQPTEQQPFPEPAIQLQLSASTAHLLYQIIFDFVGADRADAEFLDEFPEIISTIQDALAIALNDPQIQAARCKEIECYDPPPPLPEWLRKQRSYPAPQVS